MSGRKIIDGLTEAAAVARGEKEPARVHEVAGLAPEGTPQPREIIRSALEPALRGGIADNRTTRVLDALHRAGWRFIYAHRSETTDDRG